MSSIVHYSIPAFVILILLELIVSSRMHLENYKARDTFASLAMGLGNVLINIPAKLLVVGAYFAVYQLRLTDALSPKLWWVWLLLLFAEDLCYYLFHRAHHEIRFFWAAHVNHHSSTCYNLGTALRQSWTTPLTGILFWLPLPLIGFHPLHVMTAQAISLLYQFWIHTETVGKLGPLEWFMNTPSHHRVHHASDAHYLDRNHAGIFIIWDRLLGTFAQEEGTPTYGLVHNIETYNPARIAFHEFGAIWRDATQPGLGVRDRLLYVFGPPGWSHDGTRHTSDQHSRRCASTQ